MDIAVPVDPLIVPPVAVMVPVILIREMAVVEELEDKVLKLALAVPFPSDKHCPVPVMDTSEMVTVPKPDPVIAEPVVLPMVSPLIRLLPPTTFKLMACVPATMVVKFTMVPFPLFMAGRAVLYTGTVYPVMLDRLAVAS